MKWFREPQRLRPADRPIPWKRHLLVFGLLPIALGLSWIAGRWPSLLEKAYCENLYPAIAHLLALLFAWIPFAVAEWLGLLLLSVVIVHGIKGILAWRRSLRSFVNLAGHGLLQLLSSAAVLIVLFTLGWGLNYRRLPLTQRLAMDTRPPTRMELIALGQACRAELDLCSAQVLRTADGTAAAVANLAAVQRGYSSLPPLIAGTGPLSGRPKRLLASFLLESTMTTGIFIPFTGEPLVARGIPAAWVPFTAAHETAHQRGLAREEEASFVAILACRRHPDPAWRYSGAIEAFRETRAALFALDPEAARDLGKNLPAGVRADESAYASWILRHSSPVSRTSQKVYGSYLKAQGQAMGIASYRQVLLLLLGDWRKEHPVQG